MTITGSTYEHVKSSVNAVDLHGALKVSDNGRFLVHEDGEPFFWLADTAWELFHQLNREDSEYYLDQRARNGFTVIQAVVLAELDGLRTPNAYGDLPLDQLDPTRPNENYFRHVDWVIQKAAKKDLYIALLPTWGDKLNRKYDWAQGPEIFDTQNAFQYGRYLAQRYKKEKNLIWILGGDRDPTEREIAIWRSLATGIEEGLGRGIKPLMSFHPQPFEGGSSSRWFHRDDWLSFNMLQTGHDRDTAVYDQIAHNYSLLPVKPVIDAEPTYEAHGISFKPFELGYSSDADIRKYAYWNTFSGAFGHTYGCHSVWQFYKGIGEGVNYPIYQWRDALELAGAMQMKYLKRLFQSRPMLSRIPDQALILQNQPKGADRITATRAEDGSYAFVYTPSGMSFSLNRKKLSGEKWNYCWYSPKDGQATVPKQANGQHDFFFLPPCSGYGCDWVLIVDDIARAYPRL